MKQEEIEYTEDDVRALFDVPTYNGQPTPLPLPLCVPQYGSGINNSFARCYSPWLPPSHIQLDDWLAFVDGLNKAYTASPPLRVLDTAGHLVGMVPSHTAMIAGMVMQTTAQVGMHVASNRLTDLYLKHANEHYFGPRGLKVQLAKTAAVAQLLGLGSGDPSQGEEGANPVGRALEAIGLHLPLVRTIIVKNSHTPRLEINPYMTVTERRLQAFQGRICPLDLNVPQQPPSKSWEFSDKAEIKRRAKEEANAARARHLLAIREGRTPEGPVPPLSKKDAKKVKELQKAARKDLQAGVDPASKAAKSKERTKVAIADRIEMVATRDMLWIVVTNIDDGIEERRVRQPDAKPHVYSRDAERYQASRWEGQYDQDGWQDYSHLNPAAGPSWGSPPGYHSSPNLNGGWRY